MIDKKSLFEGAPLDDEGFTLVDRWYCKETETFYPVGTTTREVEMDMLEAIIIHKDERFGVDD